MFQIIIMLIDILMSLLIIIAAIIDGKGFVGARKIQEQQTVFVSKVESAQNQLPLYICDCYNATENEIEHDIIECRCFGKELKQIPIDLNENIVNKLTISDCDMEVVQRDSLRGYRHTLKDV